LCSRFNPVENRVVSVANHSVANRVSAARNLTERQPPGCSHRMRQPIAQGEMDALRIDVLVVLPQWLVDDALYASMQVSPATAWRAMFD